MGMNVAAFGVLGYGENPWVHRPPGYPLWLGALLRATADPRVLSHDEVFRRGAVVARVGDSLLLGVSSLFLFVWLARRLRPSTAFAAAVLLGTNAYTLVMATLIHYDMLQWAATLGVIVLLDGAFSRPAEVARRRFLGAGIALGLLTLIRPVTLLAPATLLPLFLLGGRGRRSKTNYLLLTAGMAIALLPWTLRNFAITGRLIPVNVQGWTAVFGSTSEVARRDPDRYEWGLLTLRHYLPLFKSVTGESDYRFDAYVTHILPLEDEAKRRALQNIAEKPGIYLSNVLNAARSLTTDVNAVLLTAFTRVQSGEGFDRRWIFLGVRKAMNRGPEAHAFQLLHDLLLGAAAISLGVGLVRRDLFMAPALGIWGAILATHALSYLDFYYYAAKIPFLVAFAFYGIDALPRAPRYGVIGGLLALSLGLSWSMRLLG